MRILQELLGRYAHIRPPHGVVKKEIVRIVRHYTGYSIEEHDVDIQGKTIRISAPSGTKQKIFLQKKNILEQLRQHIGQVIIEDIR